MFQWNSAHKVLINFTYNPTSQQQFLSIYRSYSKQWTEEYFDRNENSAVVLLRDDVYNNAISNL